MLCRVLQKFKMNDSSYKFTLSRLGSSSIRLFYTIAAASCAIRRKIDFRMAAVAELNSTTGISWIRSNAALAPTIISDALDRKWEKEKETNPVNIQNIIYTYIRMLSRKRAVTALLLCVCVYACVCWSPIGFFSLMCPLFSLYY